MKRKSKKTDSPSPSVNTPSGECVHGPELTKTTTYGVKYGHAMEIQTQEAADAYFERCVQHQLAFGLSTREEAEKIERTNLAYFAGYYSNETRERVERLFHCEHPIFGAIAKNGAPSFESAFAAGFRRLAIFARCRQSARGLFFRHSMNSLKGNLRNETQIKED